MLLRSVNWTFKEKLNPEIQSDDGIGKQHQGHQLVSSNVSKLPSGVDKLRSRTNGGSKREQESPKDGPLVNIYAQTFTFCELAAATKNFKPECFIGEGGFGRVYKGRLESTGQILPAEETTD